MSKTNAKNQRLKREYFTFLKEAKQQSEASVDAAAQALAKFEAYTRERDFGDFHPKQAIGFKAKLADQTHHHTAKPLSKATVQATLRHIRAFFQWLAGEPGFRSRLTYADAEYFNLSKHDARIALHGNKRPAPTLEQVKHTINVMPRETEIERRNQALLAFALLTGARDGALASARLKHVDLADGCFFQDAREVKTKFAKTFTTTFFPVGEDLREIVSNWVNYLRVDKLWGNDDPLFPATLVELGPDGHFAPKGISHRFWSNASPLRAIYRTAFASAGLPYFNPHSFRSTLAVLGETICRTPEELKAWSQNLGHEHVLTTFTSYGTVSQSRQAQIIQSIGSSAPNLPEFQREQALARMIADMVLTAQKQEQPSAA